MSLIGQFAGDVAQSPRTAAGVVGVTTNLGIFAILDRSAGLVILVLSIVLTLVLIRSHFIKMKILQIELDEKKKDQDRLEE